MWKDLLLLFLNTYSLYTAMHTVGHIFMNFIWQLFFCFFFLKTGTWFKGVDPRGMYVKNCFTICKHLLYYLRFLFCCWQVLFLVELLWWPCSVLFLLLALVMKSMAVVAYEWLMYWSTSLAVIHGNTLCDIMKYL